MKVQHGRMLYEGLFFLKLLIIKSLPDTFKTDNMLHTLIVFKLPSKIIELSGKVTEFNNHVQNIENAFSHLSSMLFEQKYKFLMKY